MAGMESTGTAAGLLTGQARILASIASGAALNRTLDSLTALIEQESPGALASVLLLDETGTRMYVAAGPNLPAEYNAAIDGALIGAAAGSCGTAAYTGNLVVTEDISTDPRWAPWREAALSHGLRACWSTPIFSRQWKVLGTFGMYHTEPGGPSTADLEMIGVAAHLASVAIDQAQSEDACQRSEGKFQAVFNHAFSAMLIVDDAQCILDANPATALLLGASREELLGKHINIFSEPVLPRELPDWTAAWSRFLADGEFSGERVIRTADGGIKRAFYHAKAHFLPGEHLCVMLDVTPLRRSEEAVAQTEQLYRTLVETTNTGYCVVDPQKGVVDANAEYVRLTGFSSVEEIRGCTSRDWTAPHDADRNEAETARCVQDGTVRNLEIDYIDRAGKITPVEINATSIQTENGPLLLALVRDITERKSARQELQTGRDELENRVRQRTAELAHANAQLHQRARQQEAVAAFGRQAVMGSTLDTLLQEAAEQVAATLDVDLGCVMEHSRDGAQEFTLRACAGWPNAPIGLTVSYAGRNTSAGHVINTREPLIVEDLANSRRFVGLMPQCPLPLHSGMTVLITGEDGPFGVLSAHSAHRREFTKDDVHFLQSMANVLAAAIERKHSEQALQTAQQGAVRANNAKSEFLSRMSHELRTPLNAILGFGQLLEIDHLTTRQEESVSQIVRAGRHLLELVNEVLDITRIEAGQLSLASEPIAAAELLREAADLMRPLADARRITINLLPEILEGDYHVLADRQRLRQVLLNLLSNAVKYNLEGGGVEVGGGLSEGGERLRMEVRDTGVGIPAAKLSRLFTPFERLGAEKTGIEGNGMGLALSKRLVDSQRGLIGATSVENSGSVFWIEMPVAAVPTDDPTLSADILEELFALPVLREDPDESYGRKPEKPAPAAQARRLTHRR